MKTIEILTHTHTHDGVDLQQGALIQVDEGTARFLVNLRIGRIVDESTEEVI